jgi:hypothetical protein
MFTMYIGIQHDRFHLYFISAKNTFNLKIPKYSAAQLRVKVGDRAGAENLAPKKKGARAGSGAEFL